MQENETNTVTHLITTKCSWHTYMVLLWEKKIFYFWSCCPISHLKNLCITTYLNKLKLRSSLFATRPYFLPRNSGISSQSWLMKDTWELEAKRKHFISVLFSFLPRFRLTDPMTTYNIVNISYSFKLHQFYCYRIYHNPIFLLIQSA